jgi:hypothetical protein
MVRAKVLEEARAVEVEAENARAVALHLQGLLPAGAVEVRIAGKVLKAEWKGKGRLPLVRGEEGPWKVGPPPGGPGGKRPGRTGPFKRAFDRRFVMVVGTGGSAAERRAALRRAGLDAQTWWYRANGRAEIVPDQGFDPARYRGRNTIFYGHSGMNSALAAIADRLPVRPVKGAVLVGDVKIQGPRLACLAVSAHPDDPEALVGVVGGSDAAGITLSGTSSVIRSGIGYPDFTVWSDEVLQRGFAGIRAAGFLGPDWKVDFGDAVIRSEKEF